MSKMTVNKSKTLPIVLMSAGIGLVWWLSKKRMTPELPPGSTQYTLTIKYLTEGGSVTWAPNKSQYAKGEAVVLQATPKTGYRFDHWEIENQWLTDFNPVSIPVLTSHTIMAVFTQSSLPPIVPPPPPVPKYTLSVKAVGGTGSVIISPVKSLYASGEIINLEAEPAIGYYFDHWEVNGYWLTDANVTSMPVMGNHTIIAVFGVFTPND